MIIIIGGGPIGFYLGGKLARAGKDVSIYEEHSKIGEPVQCTGIVTKEIDKILDLPEEIVVNRVEKVRVYSKKRKIEIPSDDIVVDRAKFDRYLAKKAREAGVKIYLEHKFIGLRGNNAVFVDKKDKIVKAEAEAIIGADGPLSEVAKANNMFGKRNFYLGIQARIKGQWDKDVYETYFGDIAPGFFAWILPESEKIARIGIGAKDNTRKLFRKFLEIKGINEKSIIDFQAGLIPIYDKNIRLKRGKVYLVGDAAAQVKASTGGGLVPGLKAARKLAKVLIKGGNYRKEISEIRKELRMHLKLRKGLDKFSNKDYNKLLELIGNEKIQEVLWEYNRDNAKKLVFKAVKAKPSLLRFTTKFIN